MEDLHAASATPLPAMADPDSSSLDVIFDVGKDPDPASLEAAMQVPITVMLGPAGPLLRKLHSLVPSHLLSTGEIRLLKVLCISLKNMSGDDEASFMVRWWMKMVRELCYDTEDHLDEVSAGAGADHDFSGLIACAKDTCERRKCFQWSPKTTKWVEGGVSRLKLPVPLGAHVEPPKKLVEMLALDDDEKMLKVIPINGCAGVGKTTVARTLYHRHGKKFQCRAFITVSRNPYMRGLLNRMLSQLKAPLPDNFPDVPDLIDAINKHLQGKRYFIVIDDLWTTSVWNIISRTFPRGDSCSRIIITTQIDDVALECCCYYPVYIYKMEPLNDDESRELFGRVFGSQDSCPPDIKEVPYDIIRKCGGLPLAIVNIANLATEPSTAKWKYIQDSFPSTSVGMKDFLNIMYNCLPPHLRTCLLYLSMYAHSYVIKKNELIKHWIAEGFLGAVEERDTEKIAQGYFDELVIRGMVQAMDTGYNGKVLSYSVREIVMDFIRRKSREENFVITVDYNQSTLALPDKVRRLSVQFGGVKSAYIPESIVTSQVRSLIFWGFFKCVPSSFQDYGLLRILILHIWADKDDKSESVDLRGIGELFLLKYLKIECNITIKLPDQTIGLQHLETLEVDAKVVSVPSDIVNLKRLLHLQLPSEYILPSVFANMTSLRTLGYFDLFYTVEDILHLRRLTNLQDLQLTCSTVQPAENLERNVQRLGSILEKLRVLQSITLVPAASGSSCVNIPEDGFSMASPPLDLLLQRIELSRRCCIFFSLPKWFAELRKLCILKIAIRELSMNDTDLLKGLPALTTLTLYIQTAPADKIVIHKGGFQELTYFKFMCAAPCLSFVQGAMPKVQELELGFNSNKQRSHTFVTVGFRHLTCLTEVSVKLGVQDAEEVNINDAESGLEAAVRCHPNSPITRVQFVDVISYGEEKLQEIRDGKKKKRQRSEEKRHGIEGGKRKRERSEEKRHEIEGDKKKRERSEEKLQEIEGDKKRMERSVEHVSKQLVDNRYARTGCIFTPVKHHQESVDVVMGAMGPLLPKLLHLLKDEYNMEVEVKDSVESLHKKLEGMQASLREVAMLETAQLNAVTRIWAREVRDLSYDTEDTIDSLPVHIEGSQGRNKGLITWVTEFISGEKSHQEIFDAINVIIKQARDLASRPERYMVRVQIAANPNAAPNFEHHRLFALYNDPKEMVGINISRDEVIRKLTHGTGDMSAQLKIVSIVGMGGLGKSTLAKAVYDKIQRQYDYTAFVTVSRSPDWRKVYIDILFQIDKQKYMNLNLAIFDERQLIDEVRELLANERYLIVFDDIWDVNSLEVTKFALIDSGVGSRVVTTTRILEVAVNADDVYSLKALSHSHSEELFNTRLIGGTWKNNRLFDGKDNIPCVAPKVPENLLQKCGGVPLAIIMMASLLERTPRNVWSKVYNNIGFGYEVGGNTYVDGARKILLSSYYDLPYHLRACLLHLHIFPENYLIKKETLIWKWAAEGLIVEQPGRGLFEVGEEYLKELINRNVVMPVEDDSHCGEVIGCRVHYLVLEMICYLSTEENFVTVLDGNEQYFLVEGMTRRLAVQKWAAEQGDPLAKIIRQGRLRSFYTMSCHFSAELSLSRFRFLRVISIEECTFSEGNLSGLEHLGKLHLLRYIRLYGTAIKKLPEEIGDLIYLQTLDLMGTGVRELPRGVARLRQLKCLRTDILKVPYWMGNLASLEELRVGVVNMSENFTTDLGKLTELRELDIWIESLGERQKETLVQSMRKLEKIQILRLRSFSDGLNLEGFDPPGQLRELLLSITPSRLPAWINVSRVPILSHLYVNVGAVTEQDLENLGSLPKLISLDLVLQSDAVLSISDRNGAFPRLRYFGTSAVVRFLPGAMPRLEFLRLGINVQALEDANVNFDNAFFASTLENLPSLQKVVVRLRSTGDVEAIDEALKHAVDQHPNRPSLHVITINWQGNAC